MENEIKSVRGGKRVAVYDWLRLFATIYVVIGHSTYLSIHTAYGGVTYELPSDVNAVYYSTFFSWCRYLAGWVYSFHMPLFFMLSGAVSGLKPTGSLDEVVRSKGKRLLIPYFICGWLFMLPVKRLGNFYDNDSLKTALRGFLSGEDSGHLWFLTALFWCIILFNVYKKVLEKFRVTSIYSLLLLGGVIQLTYAYLPFDVLGLKTGLSYIFYFAIGFVFEKERVSNQRWSLRKIILACILLVITEILNKRYGILNDFFAVLAGSFMTYLLADICDRMFMTLQNSAVWKFMIRNLFYVYLFHDPMEYIVLRLFIGREWLTSAFGCGAYVFCRTVLIFVSSLCMGEFLKVLVMKGKNAFKFTVEKGQKI